MAIAFRHITFTPLRAFDAFAPNGAVIGIVGEDGAGQSQLLRLAAGIDTAARTSSGPIVTTCNVSSFVAQRSTNPGTISSSGSTTNRCSPVG